MSMVLLSRGLLQVRSCRGLLRIHLVLSPTPDSIPKIIKKCKVQLFKCTLYGERHAKGHGSSRLRLCFTQTPNCKVQRRGALN